MTTSRQFSDSEGDFNSWQEDLTPCPHCNSENTEFRVWESHDGAYEDYHHRCKDCGHTWWIDGIDS